MGFNHSPNLLDSHANTAEISGINDFIKAIMAEVKQGEKNSESVR